MWGHCVLTVARILLSLLTFNLFFSFTLVGSYPQEFRPFSFQRLLLLRIHTMLKGAREG